MALAHNAALAIQFLEWVRPGGPWILTAIQPDVREAPTETALSHDEVTSFLDRFQNANIYYTLNRTSRPLDKKPTREDIHEMCFVHVDCDPRRGADPATERERILASMSTKLPPGVPRPSAVIDSGGGYQALWRLESPMEIRGEQDLYEKGKRYNLQLELLFGGDHCHNVDRILRVAGTVNYPNEKKRLAGRTPALSTAIWLEPTSYPLKNFTPAPEVNGGTLFSGANTTTISGNVRRLASLDELPDTVSPEVRIVISHGHDPENVNRWPSRSEPLFWVTCALVRAGVPDDTIYAILTDPSWGISESVLDKGTRAEKYAIHQIDRAKQRAISKELLELNDRFAVVNDSGRVRIITEVDEELEEGNSRSRRTRVDYMSFADFGNLFMNKQMEVTTAKGSVVQVPLGKWWLQHPARREYSSVIFSPGTEKPGAYNLWRGFSVQAKPGSCDLYLAHVRDVICSGDQEHYDYLIKWMASAVQNPAVPGQTAVILRGRQGTGKNVFAEVFGNLFGSHFIQVRDANHLFGQFNLHLRTCVVLFANESFWAGNKANEGKLKSLITERTMVVEGKGDNAYVTKNCVKLLMASNEDWVVPADIDDRRCFVLDVSSSRKEDRAYFGAIQEEIKNGGAEALLWHLLSLDLTGFNISKLPKTEALREQRILSFKPDQRWWFDKLWHGRILEHHGDWADWCFATEVMRDFHNSHPGNDRWTPYRIGNFLGKATGLGTSISVTIGGIHDVIQVDGSSRSVERPKGYRFPSLAQCRKHWDEHFGGPYDWPSQSDVIETNSTLNVM